MALPKRPDDGEAGRFSSITPNGKAYDPTQDNPRPRGVFPTSPASKDKNSWGQWSPGEDDSQGGQHDYSWGGF
jgi:hypothetical protein